MQASEQASAGFHTDPDHVAGMAEWLASVESNAGSKRVRHHAEDVHRLSGGIGRGHSLQARRADRENQVEASVGQGTGDAVGGGQVVFRVELLKLDVPAVDQSLAAQPVDCAFHALIENGPAVELEDGHPPYRAGAGRVLVPIREQQPAGDAGDEGQTKPQAPDNLPHIDP